MTPKERATFIGDPKKAVQWAKSALGFAIERLGRPLVEAKLKPGDVLLTNVLVEFVANNKKGKLSKSPFPDFDFVVVNGKRAVLVVSAKGTFGEFNVRRENGLFYKLVKEIPTDVAGLRKWLEDNPKAKLGQTFLDNLTGVQVRVNGNEVYTLAKFREQFLENTTKVSDVPIKSLTPKDPLSEGFQLGVTREQLVNEMIAATERRITEKDGPEGPAAGGVSRDNGPDNGPDKGPNDGGPGNSTRRGPVDEPIAPPAPSGSNATGGNGGRGVDGGGTGAGVAPEGAGAPKPPVAHSRLRRALQVPAVLKHTNTGPSPPHSTRNDPAPANGGQTLHSVPAPAGKVTTPKGDNQAPKNEQPSAPRRTPAPPVDKSAKSTPAEGQQGVNTAGPTSTSAPTETWSYVRQPNVEPKSAKPWITGVKKSIVAGVTAVVLFLGNVTAFEPGAMRAPARAADTAISKVVDAPTGAASLKDARTGGKATDKAGTDQQQRTSGTEQGEVVRPASDKGPANPRGPGRPGYMPAHDVLVYDIRLRWEFGPAFPREIGWSTDVLGEVANPRFEVGGTQPQFQQVVIGEIGIVLRADTRNEWSSRRLTVAPQGVSGRMWERLLRTSGERSPYASKIEQLEGASDHFRNAWRHRAATPEERRQYVELQRGIRLLREQKTPVTEQDLQQIQDMQLATEGLQGQWRRRGATAEDDIRFDALQRGIERLRAQESATAADRATDRAAALEKMRELREAERDRRTRASADRTAAEDAIRADARRNADTRAADELDRQSRQERAKNANVLRLLNMPKPKRSSPLYQQWRSAQKHGRAVEQRIADMEKRAAEIRALAMEVADHVADQRIAELPSSHRKTDAQLATTRAIYRIIAALTMAEDSDWTVIAQVLERLKSLPQRDLHAYLRGLARLTGQQDQEKVGAVVDRFGKRVRITWTSSAARDAIAAAVQEWAAAEAGLPAPATRWTIAALRLRKAAIRIAALGVVAGVGTGGSALVGGAVLATAFVALVAGVLRALSANRVLVGKQAEDAKTIRGPPSLRRTLAAALVGLIPTTLLAADLALRQSGPAVWITAAAVTMLVAFVAKIVSAQPRAAARVARDVLRPRAPGLVTALGGGVAFAFAVAGVGLPAVMLAVGFTAMARVVARAAITPERADTAAPGPLHRYVDDHCRRAAADAAHDPERDDDGGALAIGGLDKATTAAVGDALERIRARRTGGRLFSPYQPRGPPRQLTVTSEELQAELVAGGTAPAVAADLAARLVMFGLRTGPGTIVIMSGREAELRRLGRFDEALRHEQQHLDGTFDALPKAAHDDHAGEILRGMAARPGTIVAPRRLAVAIGKAMAAVAIAVAALLGPLAGAAAAFVPGLTQVMQVDARTATTITSAPGDTWARLAARLPGVTAGQLAAANPTVQARADGTLPAGSPVAVPEGWTGEILVLRTDNLSALANRFGMSPEQLAALQGGRFRGADGGLDPAKMRLIHPEERFLVVVIAPTPPVVQTPPNTPPNTQPNNPPATEQHTPPADNGSHDHGNTPVAEAGRTGGLLGAAGALLGLLPFGMLAALAAAALAGAGVLINAVTARWTRGPPVLRTLLRTVGGGAVVGGALVALGAGGGPALVAGAVAAVVGMVVGAALRAKNSTWMLNHHFGPLRRALSLRRRRSCSSRRWPSPVVVRRWPSLPRLVRWRRGSPASCTSGS